MNTEYFPKEHEYRPFRVFVFWNSPKRARPQPYFVLRTAKGKGGWGRSWGGGKLAKHQKRRFSLAGPQTLFSDQFVLSVFVLVVYLSFHGSARSYGRPTLQYGHLMRRSNRNLNIPSPGKPRAFSYFLCPGSGEFDR